MNAPPSDSSHHQKTDAPAAPSQVDDSERAVRRTLSTGWWLLAVSLPLGVTLEALHGLKVEAYLASQTRRELWRLAHAHGTLLGILCLVFGALAERHIAPNVRRSVAWQLAWGAVSMPLGFFLGGILNSEGDPSAGIVLVPVGAGLLLAALTRAARTSRT
jgi:hypothetical protein